MKWPNLFGAVCLVVLSATCAAARGAAAEDLQRALELYTAADYAHARDLLQTIDPGGLTEQQRTTRSDYLARAQLGARQMQVGPRQDAVEATTASRAGNTGFAQPINSRGPIWRAQDDASWRPRESFVSYPGNWAEICRRQERYGALQRMEDKPTREARQKFAGIVPEISFETGTTFGDAVERIRRDSGLNIFVNWQALQQFGVTREQEVTLPRLTNIPWRKVTELVLQQVNASLGGVTQLDWAIEGGVLTISTRDELNSNLSTRVYDIGDLLMPRMVVQQGTGIGLSGTGGGTGSGGGAGGITGGAGVSKGGPGG